MGVLVLNKQQEEQQQPASALPTKGERPSRFKVVPKARRTVDGIVFDSGKEAYRYKVLKQLVAIGEVMELRRQVDYPLVWNGVHIAIYRADFVYVDITSGAVVVEDVKGLKTRSYIMKKRMMLACHGITVYET